MALDFGKLKVASKKCDVVPVVVQAQNWRRADRRIRERLRSLRR